MKKLRTLAMVAVLVGVVAAILAALIPSGGPAITGKVVSYNLTADRTRLFVEARMDNHTGQAAVGQCTIEARDASGLIGFVMVATRDQIPAHGSRTVAAYVKLLAGTRASTVTAKDCTASS